MRARSNETKKRLEDKEENEFGEKKSKDGTGQGKLDDAS